MDDQVKKHLAAQAVHRTIKIAEDNSIYDQVDLNNIAQKPIIGEIFLEDLIEKQRWNEKTKHETIISTLTNIILKNLQWRKHVSINEMKDFDFPREFWTADVIRRCYNDNCLLVVYDVSKMIHIRKWGQVWIDFNTYISDKTFKYIIEDASLYQERRPMVIVDCSNVSVTQFDLSFIFTILRIHSDNFPHVMKSIIIYNVPYFSRWLRPLASKALPTRLAKMVKFANSDTLFDEIDPSFVPPCYGGTSKHPLESMTATNASDLFTVGEKYGIHHNECEKMAQDLNKLMIHE